MRKSFQRLPVRVWNSMAGALGGPGPVNIDALLDEASARAGLDDFGAKSFIEPLRAIIDSANASPALHPFGKRVLRKRLTSHLMNRLRVESAYRRHPEISSREIRRPVMIIGLPRTGTTHLINLLSRDPAFRFLTHWEALSPAPLPGEGLVMDARIEKRLRKAAAADLWLMNYIAPAVRPMQETRLDGPVECALLLMNEFACPIFDMVYGLDGLMEWLKGYDYRPVTAYHKRQLRLIDARRPAGPTKGRWLLKAPVHMHAMRAVLEEYPDVSIIRTHRDPLKVVPSMCSLKAAYRGIANSAVDPRAVGRQVSENILARLEATEAALSGKAREKVIDVYMQDIANDALAVVRAIYARFDMELARPTLDGMKDELARSPRYKFGKYDYSLSEYGLDSKKLRKAFEWYVDAYRVPLEEAR
jgi:hypothetical protein